MAEPLSERNAAILRPLFDALQEVLRGWGVVLIVTDPQGQISFLGNLQPDDVCRLARIVADGAATQSSLILPPGGIMRPQ